MTEIHFFALQDSEIPNHHKNIISVRKPRFCYVSRPVFAPKNRHSPFSCFPVLRLWFLCLAVPGMRTSPITLHFLPGTSAHPLPGACPLPLSSRLFPLMCSAWWRPWPGLDAPVAGSYPDFEPSRRAGTRLPARNSPEMPAAAHLPYSSRLPAPARTRLVCGDQNPALLHLMLVGCLSASPGSHAAQPVPRDFNPRYPRPTPLS